MVLLGTPDMPLMTDALGPFSRPVTTSSGWAQAYFDQGMQFLYAFTKSAAISSFEEAQRQDPQCAMCFWGEALARGPFLNGGMSATNAALGHEAAMEALRLTERTPVTQVERALIEAMSVRYSEVHDPSTRTQLDSTYSRTMADVYRAYPEDLDVGTVYAESIMLLDTQRANYRLGNPFVQSFHRVLEDVLARDLSHPGACHLYIHATEATEEPGKAEACADLLGSSIPGASHINHMPSHTYNRIGRWASAVRSNIEAWHSDQRAEFGEGVSYAASHNLHMLLFAASMDGQGAIAAQAAREYAKSAPGGVFYEALVLLRFGRFDEVLALDGPPEQPIQRGLWEFARGYAHLKLGDRDTAAEYLERARATAASAPGNAQFRGHTAEQLVGIGADLLEGEMLRESGRMAEALTAFERAVETQDGLRYDEPEPLNFSARHWLGAILLELDRAPEAEAVYRRSLERHPHNGWSLFGLEQAVRMQGRDAEAEAIRAEFREAWGRSDTLIRASRF
jgi:tetratricopeptide (TPR) repeat protein